MNNNTSKIIITNDYLNPNPIYYHRESLLKLEFNLLNVFNLETLYSIYSYLRSHNDLFKLHNEEMSKIFEQLNNEAKNNTILDVYTILTTIFLNRTTAISDASILSGGGTKIIVEGFPSIIYIPGCTFEEFLNNPSYKLNKNYYDLFSKHEIEPVISEDISLLEYMKNHFDKENNVKSG